MIRGLSPKFCSAAVGSLRNGVRAATGNNTPLGQRSRVEGSTMETHSLLECPHVSGVRTPVAGVFGADSLAAPRLAELVASYSPSMDEISHRASTTGCLSARSLLAAALRPSVPVIELTSFSENLREHEFGCWLHRQDVQLPCAYGGPRRVLVVLIGLNLRRNLPNKACDDGHRPHLSLTEKRPWSTTSDCRPREYVEQQVLKKSLHNNVTQRVVRYFCPA